MDTPRQFPHHDEFHELAKLRVRKVRKRGKRRMVVGVQLEADILALQAHAWASERVRSMIDRLARLAGRGVLL